MKQTITAFLILCLMISFSGLKAQSETEEVVQILKTGIHDAEKLTQYYMEPLIVGMGYGLSNGWFNTAKPHKTLGFDITISATMVAVPDNKQYFTIDPTEYNSISLSDPSIDQSPTVLGPNEDGPLINYTYTEPESGLTFTGDFNAWPGLGLKNKIGMNRVPAPTFQVGIGLIKNTDLIIRYIPNLTFGDNKVNSFGVGLKHDIGQWVPVLKRLPIDISVLGAFSGINNTFAFDNTDPDNVKEAIFDVNNWTAQLLISKKLSVLTFYGGIGIMNVNSTFNLRGEYELVEPNSGMSTTFTDPLNLRYKESALKGTLGMRFKLGIFTLHGDYTIQEYNMWSAGIGFAFR